MAVPILQSRPARGLGAIALALSLGACANTLERLSQVGEKPPLTAVRNPVTAPDYHPVSLPMPAAEPIDPAPNSLWRPGARAFFKDQRAGRVGDILTVVINIDDQAKLSNSTDRSRTTSENDTIGSVFGLESTADRVLPQAFNPSLPLSLNGATLNQGSGSIDRDEEITVKVAAVVTQVLPNGNLVIHGDQEVRVNFEVRRLQVAGVIRREDIGSDNRISYDKIAQARISYGGRGHITDVQQPRYGTQILDILYPF